MINDTTRKMRFTRLFALAAGLLACSQCALAADYPTRPIRMVVGFAAGGAPLP